MARDHISYDTTFQDWKYIPNARSDDDISSNSSDHAFISNEVDTEQDPRPSQLLHGTSYQEQHILSMDNMSQ